MGVLLSRTHLHVQTIVLPYTLTAWMTQLIVAIFSSLKNKIEKKGKFCYFPKNMILWGWGQNMDSYFGPGPWTTFMDRVHWHFLFW